MSFSPLQIVSFIRVDSLANNFIAHRRFRLWGLCGIVKELFSLGASSSMQALPHHRCGFCNDPICNYLTTITKLRCNKKSTKFVMTFDFSIQFQGN
jgi:hypothetical protein